MLKLILIACYITGYTCEFYFENADYYYANSVETNKLRFPSQHEVFNTEPKEFNVVRNAGLAFQVADTQKPFKVQTMYGTMTLVGFTFDAYKKDVRITIQFSMNNKHLRNIYIYFYVFDPPQTKEMEDHAKTHILNLEPLTMEHLEELMKQPRHAKKIKLSVQWIVDLLANEKPPRIIPFKQHDAWWYLSPPMVMSTELIDGLIELHNQIE